MSKKEFIFDIWILSNICKCTLERSKNDFAAQNPNPFQLQGGEGEWGRCKFCHALTYKGHIVSQVLFCFYQYRLSHGMLILIGVTHISLFVDDVKQVKFMPMDL